MNAEPSPIPLAGVITSSVAAVASKLDTRGEGIPLIVYNPSGLGQQSAVEVTAKFKGQAPATMHVVDAGSKETVPMQILERTGDTARILFLTYGQDAVEMAELRCRELAEAGQDNAAWRKVLEHVRALASANAEPNHRVN